MRGYSEKYQRCFFESEYNRQEKNSYHTDRLLKKTFTHIDLTAGISVSFANICSESGVIIDYRIQKSRIVFKFMLTGNSIIRLTETGAAAIKILLSGSGSSSIRMKPEAHLEGTFTIPPRVAYSSVCIHIDKSVLQEFIKGDMGKLPQDFCDILFDRKIQAVDSRFFSGLTLPMFCAARAASNGIRQGVVGRQFLLSKANELICLKLFQLMEQNRVNGSKELSAIDRQNIHNARKFLLEDIQNPPSVQELSRKVGINSLKLEQGFKREFGTTVYDYYRQYRLERAKEFLQTVEKGVAETAYEIGYSNVSHFIDAFKKRYGVTPKVFKENV